MNAKARRKDSTAIPDATSLLGALPAPHVRLDALVGEGRQLAEVARGKRGALLAAGLEAGVIDSLDARAAALEGAQLRLRVALRAKASDEVALAREASRLRREILRIVRFAARRDAGALRLTSRYARVVGLDRTVADLRTLGQICADVGELIRRAGVDAHALARRAWSVADELETTVRDRRLRHAGRATLRAERDRAAGLLWALMREVREGLRFVCARRGFAGEVSPRASSEPLLPRRDPPSHPARYLGDTATRRTM